MANNRIYLRCKACGKMLFLGKHFCQGFYYSSHDGETLKKMLNDFYDEHAYCDEEYPLECFDIRYETEPNDLLDNIEMAKDKIRETRATADKLWIHYKDAIDLLSFYTGLNVCISDDMPADFGFYITDQPRDFHIRPLLFDETETHPNCTIQILRNSGTGESSFGYWENEDEEPM